MMEEESNRPKGFVAIPRLVFESAYWKSRRTYTHNEALFDIFATVRYSKQPGHVEHKRSLVEIRRFEMLASNRFLQSRWGWSSSKVEAFITNLEKLRILQREKRRGTTVLKLSPLVACEFGNDKKATRDDTEKRQKSDARSDKTVTKKQSNPDNKKAAEPPAPLNCREFLDKWGEWEAYRRQARLPKLKPVSVAKQWSRMASWGKDNAIEAIETAIANGWQGLFQPKGNGGQNAARKKFDRNAGTANEGQPNDYGKRTIRV